MAVDPGQQFGAAPDVKDALAQQSAQRAFVRGINIGRRNEIGPKEVSQLFRIDAIVFVLSAVDEVNVKGMGQNEGKVSGLASVGQPEPAGGTSLLFATERPSPAVTDPERSTRTKGPQ